MYRSVLRDLPIRYKLLVTISAVLVLCVLLGGGVTYLLVRQALEKNIESELRNSTATMLNLVKTSFTGAIRGYLRSASDQNLEVVQHLYGQYRSGELSEAEARARAEDMILSQRIGETGYVCCIDSEGVLVVHPKRELLQQNISEYAFVQQLLDRKAGYLEYEWQNPGEPAPKPKAMSMAYFEPWDWIILAVSYREEFVQLVDVEDFRDSILALRFGASGYAYVLDGEGNAIIHPTLEGVLIPAQEGNPGDFFEEMRRRKSGKIRYAWKNPGEEEAREKLVIFDHIPEFDWVVASSSYLDEVYAPLNQVRNLFAFTLIGPLVLGIPVILRVSSSITLPIQRLTEGFATGATGDFSLRLEGRGGDEVGRLTTYFNTFMEQLGTYSASLQAEVAERRQAEAALRESEARYRSVMEAAADPMVVYDMEGRVTYLNPAFYRVFGWNLEECRGRKMDHFVPEECWPETADGIERILAGQTLSGIRTRRRTRSGEIRDISISGATFRNWDGELAGSVMILHDITDRMRAERGLALSEEMFSKAFRLSPGGIAIVTLGDHKMLNVNDALLRLVGRSRDEVVGWTLDELDLFANPMAALEILGALRSGGQLRDFEAEFRSAKGERRLGRVSAELIEIWDEPCMLASIEDITEARRLEREVIEVGDRERMRFGRELHDDLAPHLVGIEVMSGVLVKKLTAAGVEAQNGAVESAGRIRGLIREAIEKTRALARGLGTVHLSASGLSLALRELAADTQDLYSVQCVFEGGDEVDVTEDSVATQLYYIAREAVHNAVKHARGERIGIGLETAAGHVVLRVADDGVGMGGSSSGGGMGLRIMEFRARMIDAALELESAHDRGTAWTITYPQPLLRAEPT